METLNFKIRLAIHGLNDGKAYFLDQCLDEVSELDLINCQYNWIADERLWYKLTFGFNDDDVDMDVRYENELYNITLTANESFNKRVTVLNNEYNSNKQLITRTLLDWVKLNINGQLSDGIGENEVGTCIFKNTECSIWFGDIITDEPLDSFGYFYVDDPIHVETNEEVVNQYLMPGYDDEHDKLSVEYNEYVANKDISGISKTWSLMYELQVKNSKYILDALKDYKI